MTPVPTVEFADAVVRLEMLNPGSALSVALKFLDHLSPGERALYLAFYRLGITEGALAQTLRTEALLEGKS